MNSVYIKAVLEDNIKPIKILVLFKHETIMDACILTCCTHNKLEILEFLLKYRNPPKYIYDTGLLFAHKHNNLNIVKCLLKNIRTTQQL